MYLTSEARASFTVSIKAMQNAKGFRIIFVIIDAYLANDSIRFDWVVDCGVGHRASFSNPIAVLFYGFYASSGGNGSLWQPM